MSTSSLNARVLAEHFTRSEIQGHSPAHRAMRDAEVNRNAALIDEIAAGTGLDLNDLVASLATADACAA